MIDNRGRHNKYQKPGIAGNWAQHKTGSREQLVAWERMTLREREAYNFNFEAYCKDGR